MWVFLLVFALVAGLLTWYLAARVGALWKPARRI
jgi:hypothetical protein